MAIAVREPRQVPNVVKPSVETSITNHRPHPVEAQDAGFGRSESNEGLRGRGREGAEAGEGRSYAMENGFTHGRSRS